MTDKDKQFKITLKKGSVLSQKEIEQINIALQREFTVSLPLKEQLKNRLFFLLKNEEDIIAFGGLLKVTPVYFNGEEFSLLGFVNVVSNKKGKGYGKLVVIAMRNYLYEHEITGIGFTMPKNQGFYEKCGFTFTTNSTKRFIAKNGQSNEDGQIIFYFDSKDHFMKKVLSHPKKNVILPEPNLW